MLSVHVILRRYLLAVFMFDVLRNWCMMEQYFCEWDCREKCGVISDTSNNKKADCLISNARWMFFFFFKVKKQTKTVLFTHTHTFASTTPEKHTICHGSAFCCDIFFNLSAWAQISVANGLRRWNTTMLSPFALAPDFESRFLLFLFSFNFYLLLKLLCMVSNVLHSSSSSLCVGEQNFKIMEGGERMNKWRECNR